MDKFHNYGLYKDIAKFRGGRLVNQRAYFSMMLIKKEIKNHNVSLALSFGKDSMTMLHICHKYKLLDKIKIVMWNNSGMEYPDALEMRDYVVERYNLKNFVETSPEDPYSYFRGKDVLDDNVMKTFVFECIEQPRWRMMDKYNINCTLLGLRNQESRGRRINYCLNGDTYYNKREEAKIILPLAKWKAEEIFTYAAHENIPLHPHYSICDEKGLQKEQARVNMFCDLNDHQRGRISKLKTLYPDHYNNLVRFGVCFDNAL